MSARQIRVSMENVLTRSVHSDAFAMNRIQEIGAKI